MNSKWNSTWSETNKNLKELELTYILTKCETNMMEDPRLTYGFIPFWVDCQVNMSQLYSTHAEEANST